MLNVIMCITHCRHTNYGWSASLMSVWDWGSCHREPKPNVGEFYVMHLGLQQPRPRVACVYTYK